MSQSDDESVSEVDDSDDSDDSWLMWDSPPTLHGNPAALGEDQLDLLRRARYDSSKRMKCALAALSRQAGATPAPKPGGSSTDYELVSFLLGLVRTFAPFFWGLWEARL